MKLSPMMQQYMEIKEQYKDCILFFRLGDFYEMFFDDAILVSKLLELTLTGKSCGLEERAPMCGVPFHAADSYIARLVEMGYNVAVCEQLEDPSTTKGMVKRGVVKIVTPGTINSAGVLAEGDNNYLASVYMDKGGMSVSYCDISTGELYTTEKLTSEDSYSLVINELVKISAKEVLINSYVAENYGEEDVRANVDAFVRTRPDSYYSERAAEEAIRAQFGALSMTALGIDGRRYAVLSMGALLSYLLETQKQDLKQLTGCRFYEIGNNMSLDRATIRNLEITETLFEKKVSGSLLGVLNRTNTAMGARKLKQWLREPLNSSVEINDRLDAVDVLVREPLKLNDISHALARVYDFERLSGRIASGNANGKDMIALRNSISVLPDVKAELVDAGSSLLRRISGDIHDLSDVYELIDRAIVEEPPMTIKEGSVIKPGFSEELDEMKFSIKDAKAWIASLESKEKERTGITHLKVGYNKVFGYYIEVSRSNLDMVPDDYIRKQTLVGAERFITPELKEKEGLVLNAETKINKLEYEIFTEIRAGISSYINEIQQSSRAIAELDVLTSFASVSSRNGYVRPTVDDGREILIEKGRHPVIEQTTKQGMFVSNDTYVDDKDSSMLIITGPNMSGKSTYMRQTALIVLMAQTGCFVPAARAHIGIVDRIFTRIGASDNLAQGQSTFFVEMSELAYILRNATGKSLVILDEIGRGTSTYDGLSIAWATVEYLCRKGLHIRTLFATHYHELTVLEEQVKGVRNLSVDVSEEGGNIVFLHKIIKGSASRSYGIHVAKLAGIPEVLLNNAEDKLLRFESSSEDASKYPAAFSSAASGRVNERSGPRSGPAGSDDDGSGTQLSLFSSAISPITERLKRLDLMEVTPSQAIKILEELKDLLDRE